jgi:hypothetical protein
MEIKLAKPTPGDTRFTAYICEGSKILFPFTFPIMATQSDVELACKSQASTRRISIALSAADFEGIYYKMQANYPAQSQAPVVSLDEMRRKLVWAINDAEQALLDARESAFQRDTGGIPTESAAISAARKALADFDSHHPQAKPTAEAIWNV